LLACRNGVTSRDPPPPTGHCWLSRTPPTARASYGQWITFVITCCGSKDDFMMSDETFLPFEKIIITVLNPLSLTPSRLPRSSANERRHLPYASARQKCTSEIGGSQIFQKIIIHTEPHTDFEDWLRNTWRWALTASRKNGSPAPAMFSLAPRSSLSSNQTRVAAAPIRAPEKTSCQILKFKGWGFGWLLAGWGASREAGF